MSPRSSFPLHIEACTQSLRKPAAFTSLMSSGQRAIIENNRGSETPPLHWQHFIKGLGYPSPKEVSWKREPAIYGR